MNVASTGSALGLASWSRPRPLSAWVHAQSELRFAPCRVPNRVALAASASAGASRLPAGRPRLPASAGRTKRPGAATASPASAGPVVRLIRRSVPTSVGPGQSNGGRAVGHQRVLVTALRGADVAPVPRPGSVRGQRSSRGSAGSFLLCLATVLRRPRPSGRASVSPDVVQGLPCRTAPGRPTSFGSRPSGTTPSSFGSRSSGYSNSRSDLGRVSSRRRHSASAGGHLG